MSPPVDAALPWSVFVAAFVGSAALAALLAQLGTRYGRRHRERFEASVGARMREAFVFIDSARLFVLQQVLAASTTLLVGWSSGSWTLALVAALGVGALPRWLLAQLRSRRREAFRAQMADLLMLVSGALRSGSGLGLALSQAVAEVPPPARQELGLLLREQRLGVNLEQALAALVRRMPMEETMLFASALRVGADTGGSIADTLESLAEATRRKLAIEGRIRSLTAQGRLQAWIMGALPVAVGAVLFLLDPGAMQALVETRPGWGVCAAVVLLQCAGIASIRRIVKIDV